MKRFHLIKALQIRYELSFEIQVLRISDDSNLSGDPEQLVTLKLRIQNHQDSETQVITGPILGPIELPFRLRRCASRSQSSAIALTSSSFSNNGTHSTLRIGCLLV